MKFEEALEAMRKGKKAKRARWSNSSAMWIDQESGEMYTDDKPCDRTLSFEEITANDWAVISNPTVHIDGAAIRKISQEMFTEVPIEPGVMYQLESEDETMYTNLEITFKSGETITYKPDEWDDYSFTGSAVVVKKNSTWIGIYNFDQIFCVELKEK